MLLSAHNISRKFDDFVALSGVNLDVDEGELVGLIGPNGAGKSTFFNCIAGDLIPTSGRILFHSVDITRATPEAHAKFGIVRTFQVPATFAEMSVLENVMVGAFLRHADRNEARAVALDVIEFTGLKSVASAPARTLGTPGRKRLEIARALATQPKLLLLDEALAGLTPSEIQAAIVLVRSIHAKGITIVIVEHIMEVILTLAQRVIVFNQGATIATGTPREVVGNPTVIEAYLGRKHARNAGAHVP